MLFVRPSDIRATKNWDHVAKQNGHVMDCRWDLHDMHLLHLHKQSLPMPKFDASRLKKYEAFRFRIFFKDEESGA